MFCDYIIKSCPHVIMFGFMDHFLPTKVLLIQQLYLSFLWNLGKLVIQDGLNYSCLENKAVLFCFSGLPRPLLETPVFERDREQFQQISETLLQLIYIWVWGNVRHWRAQIEQLPRLDKDCIRTPVQDSCVFYSDKSPLLQQSMPRDKQK